MSILSDADIKRELGENILIYPYIEGNLKGASYNFSASKLAWRLQDKKNIYIETEDAIIIEPNTTALIETHEIIWVSEKIAGTYHSKVGSVSMGTGHIGTTLDPKFIGPSLIAVHNHSNESIKIKPEKEAFVTLAFHYLHTSSTRDHGNPSARMDILGKVGIKLTPKENRELDLPYMSDTAQLKSKLLECQDFQIIQEERQKISKTQNNNDQKSRFKLLITGLVIASIFSIFLQVGLYLKKSELGSEPWYETVTAVLSKFLEFTAQTILVGAGLSIFNKSQEP